MLEISSFSTDAGLQPGAPFVAGWIEDNEQRGKHPPKFLSSDLLPITLLV